MKGSIKLFEIFGISVNIHITFLLLPVLFFFMAGISGVIMITIVFACVTFHELTHSIVAKKFGIEVRTITLLPIGGVASMSKIPDNPKQELLISISGPLSNIFLAAVVFAFTYYTPWFPASILWHAHSIFTPQAGFANVLIWIFWANITLAAFNLLPAFPMDGGRVLRAILALKIDYVKATRIAVSIGHAFAIFFGFWGLMHGNIVLILIAIFIYIAASSEETQASFTATLKNFKVRDVLNDKFISVEKNTPISKILELVFHSHQEDFPVMEGDCFLGVVTRSDVMSAMHKFGQAKTAGDIMRRDLPAVKPEDKLLKTQNIMEQNGTRALPVIINGKLKGLVTLEDIFRIYSVLSR